MDPPFWRCWPCNSNAALAGEVLHKKSGTADFFSQSDTTSFRKKLLRNNATYTLYIKFSL